MKFRKRAMIMTLVMTLVLLPIYEVSATSLSEAEEAKRELEEDLAATQAVIDGLKSEQKDIQDKVTELDNQLTVISEKINNTQEQLEAKSEEIAEVQLDLEEAQADVDVQNEAMQKRIQYMYEHGGELSYLDAFFRSGSIAEFLSQAEYINQITEYDRDMLAQYEESVAVVTALKTQLEEDVAELETLKAQAEEQQSAVLALMTAKQDELARASAEIGEEQANADAVRAEIDAQNDIIAQIKADMAQNSGTASDNPYNGGAFSWPVPSSTRVTSDFGNRLSPTQGASSYHKGIDIGASYASDIVAAAGGTVSTAGSNYGFGNYVMINHGGGLYTVYAHCSSLLVSKGDVVTAGQTIAKVGSTGISTGNHLHFGVSLNGAYVSPWNYLSR